MKTISSPDGTTILPTRTHDVNQAVLAPVLAEFFTS